MAKGKLQASILDLDDRLKNDLSPGFRLIFSCLRELYAHASKVEEIFEAEKETRYIEIRRR